MGLFKTLAKDEGLSIDWEMTPEYTFGTFESWGGKERVRSKTERIYYFFIDDWGDEPRLCLMERGIKHARVVAEILAPPEMVRACVSAQGKVALFERTHPINQELKEWLIHNVIESDDDTKVVLLETPTRKVLGDSGLPLAKDSDQTSSKIALPTAVLPAGAEEMAEADVLALIKKYNFAEQERNPQGVFVNELFDNGDRLTVSDRVTGLMWQRGGIDIMSRRSMLLAVEQVNAENFAGFNDWRLPSMAEALSLLEPQKLANDQYLHPCFSPEQPFVFVEAYRKPGGYWFVDFKQGRAFWSSGTIPGGFGRLCRSLG